MNLCMSMYTNVRCVSAFLIKRKYFECAIDGSTQSRIYMALVLPIRIFKLRVKREKVISIFTKSLLLPQFLNLKTSTGAHVCARIVLRVYE